MRQNRLRRDLTGQRFGRLIVIRRAAQHWDGSRTRVRWACLCDCGKTPIVMSQGLLNGTTSSCGCYGQETRAKANTTHGKAHTREHKIWGAAKQRCTNPKANAYHRYGGRGIKFCERWFNDFAVFLSDMGACPEGHSLDRINNNGNYEPSNCRWASHMDQMSNTNQTKYALIDGRKFALSRAAAHLGMPRGTFVYRAKHGMIPGVTLLDQG